MALPLVVQAGPLFAADPRGDACLVALGVGQHPPHRRMRCGNHAAPGGQGSGDAVLSLIMWYGDVDVHTVAL